MRGKNECAGRLPMKWFKLDLGEIFSELQHSAVLVKIDNIKSREMRTRWNAPERIQPETVFISLREVFQKGCEWQLNGIDKFNICSDQAFTGPVAGAQLLSAHLALFQGSCRPAVNKLFAIRLAGIHAFR